MLGKLSLLSHTVLLQNVYGITGCISVKYIFKATCKTNVRQLSEESINQINLKALSVLVCFILTSYALTRIGLLYVGEKGKLDLRPGICEPRLCYTYVPNLQ